MNLLTTPETRGSNTGTSKAETIEIINKKIERVQNHIEHKPRLRFNLGRSKERSNCIAHRPAAPNEVVYDRLTHAMVSIFHGQPNRIFHLLVVTPFKRRAESYPKSIFGTTYQ